MHSRGRDGKQKTGMVWQWHICSKWLPGFQRMHCCRKWSFQSDGKAVLFNIWVSLGWFSAWCDFNYKPAVLTYTVVRSGWYWVLLNISLSVSTTDAMEASQGLMKIWRLLQRIVWADNNAVPKSSIFMVTKNPWKLARLATKFCFSEKKN